MKLYLISQSENCGYDTFDSAVVAAASKEDARRIHPANKGSIHPFNWDCYGWAEHPDQVSCVEIGEAREEVTNPHVILASFNAG